MTPPKTAKGRTYDLYVCPKCLSDNTFYNGHLPEKIKTGSGCNECGHEFKDFKRIKVSQC